MTEIPRNVPSPTLKCQSTRVASKLTLGDIDLDRVNRRVKRAGREIHLGPTEFRMLEYLMEKPGRVFTRAQLLDSIWGTSSDIDERTVDVQVGRLRKALMRGRKKDPIHTDEYDIYARLPAWGYEHKTVCHGRGEYARDEDGDGFHEIHVNTMEGFWSLLRSWLRPHRGVAQEKLPLYLAFFQFVHNARKRGKALLTALVEAIVAPSPRNPG